MGRGDRSKWLAHITARELKRTSECPGAIKPREAKRRAAWRRSKLPRSLEIERFQFCTVDFIYDATRGVHPRALHRLFPFAFNRD